MKIINNDKVTRSGATTIDLNFIVLGYFFRFIICPSISILIWLYYIPRLLYIPHIIISPLRRLYSHVVEAIQSCCGGWLYIHVAAAIQPCCEG